MFSGDARNKFQVDKEGLSKLTVEQLAKGMQSRPGNEIAGLEGRAELLIRLGGALQKQRIFFGDEGRPGNMVGEYFPSPLFLMVGQLTDDAFAQTTSCRIPPHRRHQRPSSSCPSSGTSS